MGNAVLALRALTGKLLLTPSACVLPPKALGAIFHHSNVDAQNMKKTIGTFAIDVLMTIGFVGLMAASSISARARSHPKGVFVSSIVPGLITAIADNHITIENIDGEVYDIIVESNARLDRKGSPIKLADVHVGDRLGAAGWLDGRTLRAVMVGVDDGKAFKAMFYDKKKNAESAENAREHLVMGDVTAIDSNKLTVKRTDSVVQVIELDGSASIQNSARGGLVNATLADIKVGSMISAVGGLKGDVFVAKKIYLIPMH